MKGIVYLITNLINNNKYVGITTLPLNIRWNSHKKDSKKSKYPLYKAIRKYGLENFKIESILEIEDVDKKSLIKKLDVLEIKFVKIYKSYTKLKCGGYNLTPGGYMSYRTEESKKKQSETMKKKYKNHPELKKKQSRTMKETYEKNPSLKENASLRMKERYRNISEREKTSNCIKRSYIENPSLRKKVSDIHKETHKNNPNLGKNHSYQISGEKHPLFNKNAYIFENIITKEIFYGTSYNFRKKYDLNQGKISLLINNKIKMYKSWKVSNVGDNDG